MPTKQRNWSIFVIAFVVFMIWQTPLLGPIRYPFILLGTWFHEMGHGLTAVALGGHFSHLEIYENGGGVAFTSLSTHGWIPYAIARASVAAGGLLGPCIFGAILIMGAARANWSVWILRALIVLMVASILIWVRSLIGATVLSLIAAVLTLLSSLKNKAIAKWVLLFLGIQCTFSTYLQLNYLFTGTFERFGQTMTSDTQVIATNLFGFYWMWAIVICCISAYVLWKSYAFYLRNNRG
ncbi:M50 family metallopeptidase [Aquimarina agarilytica]|uniref:M50 family metallopeptidase n=1 Tax=Aquimarina agarilytica TaxID=1087449 RepID=UPI000289F0C7|nr:M50 family metallopeptidase [Aquimarina agarilytica]